jgi:hypothetical protein
MDQSLPAVPDGYVELLDTIHAAGRQLICVRWEWDLPCCIWLLLPREVQPEVEAALRVQCQALAEAFDPAERPARLEVALLASRSA